MPFVSPSVNLAGQPSQVGGRIARVAGWVALIGGLFAALIVGALFQAIFPAGVVGWVLGSTIGLVATTIGLLLIMGGKRLHVAGTKRERDVRTAAVTALAARNRGVLTPDETARALGMTVAAADALLTDLVRQGENVRLEVDDDGRLLYLFGGASLGAPRVRVGAPAVAGSSRIEQPGDTGQTGEAIDEDDLAASNPKEHARR